MGIQSDPETERFNRLQKILQVIEEEFPPDNARHTDWLNLAVKWAEANVLWYSSTIIKSRRDLQKRYEPLQSKYGTLRQTIDLGFLKWLQQRYGTLYNLPSLSQLCSSNSPVHVERPTIPR